MSLISRLIKPRVYPGFYNVSNRSTINVSRHFCSSNSINSNSNSVEESVLIELESYYRAVHSLNYFRHVERDGLFTHTKATYNKIFDLLFNAWKHDLATRILMEMATKGFSCDEDMFVLLIDRYRKADRFQKPVMIFKKMTEFSVTKSVISYNALFRVLVRHGKYFMAERYYNEMIQEGIVPTMDTFNLLLSGFLRCRKGITANRFYEDMKSRGIMPDAVTYDTLINGFCCMNRVGEAEKYFEEMKESEVVPTVFSYNAMIKGYLLSGKEKEALRMFEEMKGFGINPDAVTYTTLVPALCNAMMPEAGLVLKDMIGRRICPKGFDNSVFFNLLTCQSKAGNVEVAIDLLKAMIVFDIPTEAGQYEILIENFSNTDGYIRAMNLVYELMDKEVIPKCRSTIEKELSLYNTVIEYLCDNGKTGKADKFFRKLIMVKGIVDPLQFYNLITGHLKERNQEAAFKIQKIMVRRGVLAEPDSYRLLIDKFVEKHKPDYAQLVLDTMIEHGHCPDSYLFRMVVESFLRDQHVQAASRVIKTMLEQGVTDDMYLAVNILASLFMRGHIEEAHGIVELLMRSRCAVDIDHLLSVWTKRGQTKAALKLLEFSLDRDFTVDLSSYDKVLNSLLPPGKTLNAYPILWKISSNGIVSTDRKNIKSLIKMLNEEGNHTKHADILARLMMGD